jgi:hypothetical protein
LEIVELEYEEENQIRKLEFNFRHSPEVEHHDKDRHLHEAPSHFVVDSRSPFLSTHFAITSIYEVEGNKHNQSYKKEDKEKIMK